MDQIHSASTEAMKNSFAISREAKFISRKMKIYSLPLCFLFKKSCFEARCRHTRLRIKMKISLFKANSPYGAVRGNSSKRNSRKEKPSNHPVDHELKGVRVRNLYSEFHIFFQTAKSVSAFVLESSITRMNFDISQKQRCYRLLLCIPLRVTKYWVSKIRDYLGIPLDSLFWY